MQIATRIIVIQCLLGIALTGFWLAQSTQAALAAAGGSGAAIIPAMYLRWRMQRALRWQDEPRALVGSVYGGQVGKFALTCVLLALTVARFPQEFLPVMTSFTGCVTAYWLAMASRFDQAGQETGHGAHGGQRKR